jgi:hypothetical protein
MSHRSKGASAIIVRLIVVLALLGCPRVSCAAQGTWSAISLPLNQPGPGQVVSPEALALDSAGNLYVADWSNGGRIQKRDAQGHWSVLATQGTALGQVSFSPPWAPALALDSAGNLYVADSGGGGRIQERDAQGNWSVIAASGWGSGQVSNTSALAVDSAGDLYILDHLYAGEGYYSARIQKRDAQGNWSSDLGQVDSPTALAVDAAGNLYVAEVSWFDENFRLHGRDRIQKRDAQGNWSAVATDGSDLGQVYYPTALAVDAAGNLHVGEGTPNFFAGHGDNNRIQKRDARRRWSVVATSGSAVGNVGFRYSGGGVAVDGTGNLYVADTGNNRVLMYTPQH